jgi:hypothetical protein
MLVALTVTGTDRVGVMRMFGLRRRSGHAFDANVPACACGRPQPGCSWLCRSQQSLRRIKCRKWASMFAKNAALFRRDGPRRECSMGLMIARYQFALAARGSKGPTVNQRMVLRSLRFRKDYLRVIEARARWPYANCNRKRFSS